MCFTEPFHHYAKAYMYVVITWKKKVNANVEISQYTAIFRPHSFKFYQP